MRGPRRRTEGERGAAVLHRVTTGTLGVVAAACNPIVVELGDDDGTTESGIASASHVSYTTMFPEDDTGRPSGSTGGTTGVTSNGDAPDTAVAFDIPSLPEESEGEGSTGEECGCPEPTPLAFDGTSQGGVRPSTVLETLALTTYAWTWSAVEGQPTSTMQLSIAYEGGDIEEWSGEDPCEVSFVGNTCERVSIPVHFEARTPDGFFLVDLPGAIEFTSDAELALLLMDPALASEIDGTLLSQPLQMDGKSFTFEEIELAANWVLGAVPLESDATLLGDGILLGSGSRLE